MEKQIIYDKECTRWGVFEATVKGPKEGNPFTDQYVKGIFKGVQETVRCDGFYDGEGVYKVRFMPSWEGIYEFHIETGFGICESGTFQVRAPEAGNHGPVRVAEKYHMKYDDGTPYYSIGTTCYVWHLQNDEMIEKTLDTLADSAFNKLRFCIFPKHYDYNLAEPRDYPYEGTPVDSSGITSENFLDYTGKTEGNNWDFTRFKPAYFRHIERCIRELGKLGIEADLIVMHPYDRWGFSGMDIQEDELYWNYIIARFSSFHNVWWSLANEYDLMTRKTDRDWEKYAEIVCNKDPYFHMRSIHNCVKLYDYSRSWITHCSLQRTDLYKSGELTGEYREQYQKPVIMDEIAYEGNIQHGWGNITSEEMVRRFWETACRGGYPGHGETCLDESGKLWWAHGGILKGESYKRFEFLLKILKETPGHGLAPYRCGWDEVCAVPEAEVGNEDGVKEYYLFYYSFMRPSWREFYFDTDSVWQVTVLDTYGMTSEERGTFTGRFRVELPGKQYMAIQIRKVNG